MRVLQDITLPAYVSDFTWDLLATKTWIVNSGITEPMEPAVTTPPNNSILQAVSDGKSKVEVSVRHFHLCMAGVQGVVIGSG